MNMRAPAIRSAFVRYMFAPSDLLSHNGTPAVRP